MEIIVKLDESSVEKTAREIIAEVGSFIFSKSQENLVKISAGVSDYKITDTGYLLLSGRFEMKGESGLITYDAPHAEFVEFGTRPHMPPVHVLKDWAKRKLGKTDKEAESISWAIANKIRNEGTEPKPFLRNAVEQGNQEFGG